MEQICQHSQKAYPAGAGLKFLERATVAGKPACMFRLPGAGGRRDFYVNMLFQGRWLELHYSASDGRAAIETGRQTLEALVASLSARRIDNKPTDLPLADLGDAEATLAQNAQGCGAKSKDFICRSLAAFKAGKRPSGRPEPVGIVGLSIPVVFGPIEMEARATYIVVSDTGVRTDGFGITRGKEQEKATQEVIRAVKAGRHPDEDNLLVAAARAEKRVDPAVPSEKSLVISTLGRKSYVRETSVGIVFFGLVVGGQGMILGVYPTP